MQRSLLSSAITVLVATGIVGGAGFYFGNRHGVAAATDSRAGAAAKPAPVAARGATARPAAPAAGKAPAKIAMRHPGEMLNSAASNGSPLPPPKTPLKDELAALKARADAGDAAAASRLFQDLQTCAQVQRLNQFMPALANQALNGNFGGPNGDQRNERMLDMAQRNLDYTQNNAAMCADLSPTDMANLLPATLQAAQLGDPQAATCYVGTNLNSTPGLADNPQWISDYQSNALNLANSALQSGDWAMASLLAQAYGGSPRSNNMLNQLTGSNIAQAYTYAMLMSLGQPTGSNGSQRSAAMLNNLSSQLTPDQISTANQQAQSMYQQYFNSTPRQPGAVAGAMNGCQGGGAMGGP